MQKVSVSSRYHFKTDFFTHRWDLTEFTYLPSAGSERVHSNIVHYKDQVLATGGCEKLDNCYNTVEAFDWESETWEEKAAVPLPGTSLSLICFRSSHQFYDTNSPGQPTRDMRSH